ncbi:PH domain-containing protein [Marmoricola sp. RAF53]|uniref:PH domain-containing protein n=1 Tax=Marmoricola sp. RAF53 TaxID=3233059 RepID=UPI003F98F115
MTASDAGPLAVPEVDWRRLDPKMLLVYPVGEVARLAVPLLALLFLGSGGPDVWHLLVVAIPVALGIWRYATTAFRITHEHVELRHGLISNHVTRARLDKVRTVALDASPIHRVLALAKVRIGTGDDAGLELNALPTAQARALRAALLHAGTAAQVPASGVAPVVPDLAGPQPDDDVLLRFDPSWLLLAPFTGTGLFIAAGALAAASGPFQEPASRVLEKLDRSTNGIPVVALVAGGALLVGITLVVLSVAGYALTNWGFTFSRDRAGRSWHIRKGLLSTKETSIDVSRVRGVTVCRPAGLRLVGGGSARALVTGLKEDDSKSSAQVVPAAPYRVVDAFCREAFGDVEALEVPLLPHGPRARRRQLLRPLRGVLGLCLVAAVVAISADLPWWVVLLPLVLVPFAVLIGLDRYRALGHALTAHHLVAGAPKVNRHRHLLLRHGIIGWQVHQNWFQRRAGVVTLVATTAAGDKKYAVVDVPEEVGTALAHQALPGLVAQFCA